jgi:hypothetical protein
MRLIESLGRWSMATLVLLVAAAPLYAQNAGSLRGNVTDTSGAVLPGVTVVLTNDATKATRQAVTDAKGGFFFAAVQPGNYSFSAELSGFKKRNEKGIRISPNDTKGLDFTLEVGAQTEEVTVTAEKELIQTETGAREGLITAAQIENLSIISRSPMELLRILPGVVAPDQSTLESVSQGGGANNTGGYSVNGVRGSNNVITLDGSRMIDVGSNSGLIIAPNTDFVSEVKIQSSNYAAEFGSGGVQVNAITKGGSSEFHGTVYTYDRTHQLAANDRSNSIAGVAKPDSKFLYPGANLSGPILLPGTGFNKNRDKAFFFFGIELWRQQVDTGSSFKVVPTPAQRNGFFGDTQGGNNLGQRGTVNIPSGYPGAGTPAPGNSLAPYIDPIGQKLINLYPQPNGNFNNNQYNYVFQTLQPQDATQLNLRLDYNFSDSTKAYVRLAQDKGSVTNVRGLWWGGSDYALPSPVINTSLGRSAALNVTSVLSPTVTNELLFTYSKLKLDNGHENDSNTLSALGINNYTGFFGAQSPFFPELISWGQNLGNLWDPSDQNNIFAYNSSLQLADNFTKVLNTHALKVGFSVERQHKNQNFQNDANTRLVLGGGWGNGTTGSDFGDLLTARPAQILSGTALPAGNWNAWNLDGYVQDSWKVKKNLTLEYGVRVSKWTPNNETGGLGAVFFPQDYNPAVGTFLDAAKTQVNGVRYGSNVIPSRSVFVMPRANFAWDVSGNGNLVVRGGSGLFYNRPMGNAEYDSLRIPPNGYASTVDGYSSTVPGGILNYQSVAAVNPLTTFSTIGLSTPNPDSNHYPRTANASLSVAKRIFFQQVLEVGYVGTFGRHLLNRVFFDNIPDGALLKGTIGNSDLSIPVNRVALDGAALQAQRPYPAFSQIEWWEYNGTSNYHSLQATLSRQTGRRFQYFIAYTFSKGLGTSVANGEYDPIDPFEPRDRSYGVLGYDRTHILNVSYNYQAPDIIKKGGVLGAILNGWQLSGITSWASGVPYQVSFGGDIAATNVQQAWFGTNDHRGYRIQNSASGGAQSAISPVFSCDPRAGATGNGVGDSILDLNCIQIPSFGQSGPYVTPYYLRFPSRVNFDLTLFKNFPIGKGAKKLQFRVGAFDIFNQAVPGTSGQDINLTLNTTCNVHVNHVPNGVGGFVDNVCDPTGGFSLDQNTINNYGKIILQRGHRVVELAVKFYF